MSAFERISSGIPSLDQVIDNIRLGDNVVWQVSSLADFKALAMPYVHQAIADNRNLIYIRFANHEPLLNPSEKVKTYQIDLSRRFETFTVEVHRIIEKEGFDAFYIFDCLSEIQAAWSTDLMMSNFFQVTCPYLFSLDTVAYFPIIRGKHSFEAIAKIRDTTQLLANEPDLFAALCPDYPDEIGMIQVYDLRKKNCYLYHDMEHEHSLCVMSSPANTASSSSF